jgi:hypothetical protein
MAPLAGYFEHGNESSGAINGNEFDRKLSVFCFSEAVLYGVN